METYQKPKPFKEVLGKEFIKNLDPNLKYFARLIQKDLREENDSVVAVTGYPGVGKSQFSALLGALTDKRYRLDKNICFIPTSNEIEGRYLGLKMYSVLHIDEASRGLHKHKWHDSIQQKLNLLYDTDREGHFLCTLLLMPRFQNFTENFRNFRIRYWINIIARGIAIFYRRDEDKDAKDPWNIDANYKNKLKFWKGQKTFQRSIGDTLNIEKKTKNYWFFVKVPEIPPKIWEEYKQLKADSRIESVENPEKELTSQEKLHKTKIERWKRVEQLMAKNYNPDQIAVTLRVSTATIKNDMKSIIALGTLNNKAPKNNCDTTNTICNKIENLKKLKSKGDKDKWQFVSPKLDPIADALKNEE